jgi:FMN phosphatase YigB (HAD superfamily)
MATVKAVFFDLDDTLFDCSGTLVRDARKRSASALVRAGLPLTVPQAMELQEQVEAVWGPRIPVFETICQLFSLSRSKSC